MHELLNYPWPGNIRQLRNVLRTASALCRDNMIRLPNLPQELVDTETRRAGAAPMVTTAVGELVTPLTSAPSAALREAECAACCANSSASAGTSRTAETLGISRNTLYRKIRKHGIVLSQ